MRWESVGGRAGGASDTATCGARAARARRGAAALVALLVVLVWADPAWAQVHVGGFTGAYHRGDGSHPFVYLAVGGRAGTSVAGPVSIEVEALHVPAKFGNRAVDLFAYRGSLTFDFRVGESRPFVLIGTGFQQWRHWMCDGESCRDPPGPGQKFQYDKGHGLTAGVGSRFPTAGPFWFRLELRYEHSRFPAPTNNDLMLTMGIEVRP